MNVLYVTRLQILRKHLVRTQIIKWSKYNNKITPEHTEKTLEVADVAIYWLPKPILNKYIASLVFVNKSLAIYAL